MSTEELLVENISGKQRVVKVIVKEVQKTTVACDACRNQHVKCDGKFPCSYCVAKNRLCEFSEPKKRGPKRRLVTKEQGDQNQNVNVNVQKAEKPAVIEESTLISLVAASTERDMLDNIEANKYFDFYLKFMSHMPIAEGKELVQPRTTSKKVQAYATLAASSRILGDSNMSQKYISQARMLGGLIYDSPDPDGSAAMLVMHKYFQLVLDLPRATHYATMAASIAKMISPIKKDAKMDLMCKISATLINEKLNNQQQARKIRAAAHKCREFELPMSVLSSYLDFAAIVLEVVGYHVFYASSFTLANTFQVLDNAHIGAEDRGRILAALNNLMLAAAAHNRPGFSMFMSVFGPMYMAITEWKSGNITEALAHTMTTMTALQHLQNEKTIGLVADLPHVCILGSLAKFLHSRGLDNLSRQICQYIYQICDVMSPVFDFIRALVDRFIQMNLDSESATSPTTIPSTPTSILTPSTPTILTSSTPTPTPLLIPPAFVTTANFEYRPQNDGELLDVEKTEVADNLLDNFNPFSLISIQSGTPDMVHRYTTAPMPYNLTATTTTTTTITASTFPQQYSNFQGSQTTDDFVHYIETTNTSYIQPLRFDANGEVIQ